MCEYLLAVLPNGSITTVVVAYMTIPWSSEQREERRVISRRGKQAGDIMWVRLPAPHIMVISRERERAGEPSKLVILCGLDYQHHT